MQVIKLVKGGEVDRIISFDSLPQSMMSGVRRAPLAGLPRHWKELFKELPENEQSEPFYYLEYIAVNRDKEKWQEISQYVRRVTDKHVRLLDKLEDMAVVMAPDSKSQLTLEPEEIPIIPIPKDVVIEEPSIIQPIEKAPELIQPVERKKMGRPKKALIGV